jgi:hypothetical protein
VGRKASRLYVADLARGTVSEVPGIPEDAAAGDATWVPDGSGLVYSGFPIPERRLGLIYWCVVLIGGNPRRPPSNLAVSYSAGCLLFTLDVSCF